MNPGIKLSRILPLCLVIFICFWSGGSGSHCDSAEVASCKQAVSTDLKNFDSGGTCSERSYVHYTHVCVINENKPYDESISSCCCINDRRVMCCKYKQAWNVFRCSQADDTVENISPFSRTHGSSPALKTPPLEILIPVIVIPLILIGCCIFCAVKCCRCRRNPETKGQLCHVTCMPCCGKQKQCTPQTQTSNNNSLVPSPSTQSEAAAQPVYTSQYSQASQGSESKLLPDEIDRDSLNSPLMSPPYSDRPFQIPTKSGYARLCSNSSGVLQQIPEHIQEYPSPREINSQFSTDSRSSESKLLHSMDDPVAMATAPPDEDNIDFTCPDYNQMDLEANDSDKQNINRELRGGEVFIETSTGAQQVAPRGNRTPSVGYMCPPPAYDKHHLDPVLS